MRVMMLSSNYDGCTYVRILLPTFHNGFLTDKLGRGKERKTPAQIQQEIRNADVVVFHRPEEVEAHKLMKLCKMEGKKVVVDNDDTFLIDDHHPLAEFSPDGKRQDSLQARIDSINIALENADLVTCTTKTLANEYRKINKNTVILPNYIDPLDWDEPLRNEGDKIRIGIVGSAAIEYDYLHVKDLLRKLSDRKDIELVMFGLGDKEHRKNNPIVTKVFQEEYDFWDSLNIEHFPWCANEEYQEKLNEARLDMMIIPRKDNYFNRCKSNLKFLEASMLEIPVIAQSFDDGPYEEIEDMLTGWKIRDNKDWMVRIDWMVKDKGLRRAIGKQAKKYVLKNYNIADNAYKWREAYEKLYA